MASIFFEPIASTLGTGNRLADSSPPRDSVKLATLSPKPQGQNHPTESACKRYKIAYKEELETCSTSG